MNGHEQTIEQLLGVVIHNQQDPLEFVNHYPRYVMRSALYYASLTGMAHTVDLLLVKRANVEQKDIDGDTALHVAAGNGHESTVRVLLQHEADVDGLNKAELTPLMFAASKGHLATCVALIDAGADVRYVRPTRLDTALMRATAYGEPRVLPLGLERWSTLPQTDHFAPVW